MENCEENIEKIITLYKKCGIVKNSSLSLYCILDFISSSCCDIEELLYEFDKEEIEESDLRTAFHYAAQLLKEVERISEGEEKEEPVRGKKPIKKEIEERPAKVKEGNKSSIFINIDGGSRGNPGPAAIGVVFKDANNKVVLEISKVIGNTTNNVAEYTALITALKKAVELGFKNVSVFSDSELLVRQVNLVYKTRDEKLKNLLSKVFELKQMFSRFSISHIRRELNKRADELANKALDDNK